MEKCTCVLGRTAEDADTLPGTSMSHNSMRENMVWTTSSSCGWGVTKKIICWGPSIIDQGCVCQWAMILFSCTSLSTGKYCHRT